MVRGLKTTIYDKEIGVAITVGLKLKLTICTCRWILATHTYSSV